MTTYKHITLAIASLSFMAASANAATTFITNNTAGKTLASDEGDGAALVGSSLADPNRALTLSADDGGGTLNVTTLAVSTNLPSGDDGTSMGMDADSFGQSNDKWGDPAQGWSWSFDQTVDFLGFEFNENRNTQFTFSSAAWKDDTTGQSGTGWSFSSNGTTGTFLLTMPNAPISFNFSTGSFSSVAANTEMSIYKSGASGGSGMASFTINPIPEPSSALLGGLGSLILLRRRR